MVNKINQKKNKKGWIRLVEAFVAIVLLASVLLVISSTNSSQKTKAQEGISQIQTSILRDVQLNDSLRAEILSINIDAFPVEWNNFDSEAPHLKERIEFLSPAELDCSAKLCLINEPCTLDDDSGKEIYAKSAIISANATYYSPRELKIFCVKE